MKKSCHYIRPVVALSALALMNLSDSVVYASGVHGGQAEHTTAAHAPGHYVSVGHAWAVLQHGVEAVEKAIEGDALAGIHGVEGRIASALLWLQANPGDVAAEKVSRLEAALKQAVALSANLHAASDSGDRAKTESELKKLKGALKLVGIQYAPEVLVAPADIKLDDHAAMGATTEPTIKVSATSAQALKVGEKAKITVKLVKPDGTPLGLDGLIEAHTEKIHLLVIDSSLTDYHHEHPVPGGAPGEYVFEFTPRKPGSYRVWADIIPSATGAQEYAITDIPAETKGEPIMDRTVKTVGESGGLRYEVTFDKPEFHVGDAALGTLKITRKDGTVFDQLEPLMGAYAHLVGFGDDYKAIAHVHPMGKEPTQASDRGRGELQFHLLPSQPGIMRLFAQVQIDGKSVFIPYTLEIKPAKAVVASVSASAPVISASTLKEALAQYVKIQLALAGDSLEGVSAASEAIAKQFPEDAVIQREAKSVAAAKELGEARKAFKPLSDHLIALLKVQPEKLGFYVANCPMADASWVQADKALRNPYYGSQMLKCGSIRSEQ